MSYEYMSALGALGANGGGKRRRKKRGTGLSREEANEKVIEVCGGIGCIGVTTEAVIFDTSDPEKSNKILSNMASRGCMVQCTEDNKSYYCCPPFGEESSTDRQDRIAAACRGETCAAGMQQNVTFRTNLLRAEQNRSRMDERGCTLRCEEGSWAYYCCPSPEGASEQPEAEEVPLPLPPPIEPEGGSSAPLILLGLLGLGVVGAGGYFLLSRGKDDEEEDEDDYVDDDEYEDDDEDEDDYEDDDEDEDEYEDDYEDDDEDEDEE